MLTKKVLTALVAASIGMIVAACAGTADDNESSDQQDVVAAPPPPPGNLTANVASCTRVDLSWDPVPGATSYIIMKGTAPGNETSYTSSPASSPTFSDGHLTGNTQYSYEVKVYVAGQGVSGPSNEVVFTTPTCTGPAAPTGVTATAVSSSRINVAWNSVTNATKYFVYQSTAGGPYAQVAAITPPATTYQAANLAANTNYCYEVSAQDANGTSVLSSPACATTFRAGLEAWWQLDERTGTTAADASGNNHTGTLQGAAAFATTDKAPIADNLSYVSVPAGAANAVSVADASVFWLQSTSDWSVALWVQVPTAPTGTVHFIGKRSAGCGRVNWEIAQDATNGLHFNAGTGIRSFGTTLTPGTWTHVAVTETGGVEHLYLNGVEVANGAYTAATRVTDPLQIGNSGGCGNAGDVLVDDVRIYSRALAANEVSDIGTQPPAPSNLTGTVISSTEIDLSWNASSNPTKYIVLKGTMSGDEQFYTSSPATSTTFKGGHLTPGTQYSWQVEVVSHGLISPPSNEVILSTNAAPAAPTGVTATATSSTRIDVSWTAVANAAKYYVYQSTDGVNFTFKGSVIAPTVTFGATSLTSGTTYYYEVQAEDSGFTRSAMSAPASATTP